MKWNTQDWKINQIVAGSIITFGGFGFGTALSWSATALPSLQKTGQVGTLSPIELSWIASIMAIGAMIACPVTGLCLKDRGRKSTLVCFCAVGFVGWLLLATASTSMQLYFGRALIGASVGGYTILVPTYVGEIASKELRGMIGSLFLIMLCLGKLFSNMIGIFSPANIASLLCSLHSIIYALSLMLIPDSPKILLIQKKEENAFKALLWYEAKGYRSFFSHARNMRTSQPDITAVEIWAKLDKMKPRPSVSVQDSENPKIYIAPTTFSDKPRLFSNEVLKPIMTVFILMMLAQFCGINISTFYTIEIFEMSGDFLIGPEYATVTVAVIQTIGCLPCSIFVDKYGRKVLLVSSFFIMGVSMAIFSGFFYFKHITDDKTLQNNAYLGLVPLVSLIVYNLAYSWGVGSIVWIIMSEIIPRAFLGAASAIANVIFWGSAFIVLQAFQMFKERIPLYIWFVLFMIVCTIGCVFILVALPETKGLSLEEIQAFYKKRQPSEMQVAKVNQERRISGISSTAANTR